MASKNPKGVLRSLGGGGSKTPGLCLWGPACRCTTALQNDLGLGASLRLGEYEPPGQRAGSEECQETVANPKLQLTTPRPPVNKVRPHPKNVSAFLVFSSRPDRTSVGTKPRVGKPRVGSGSGFGGPGGGSGRPGGGFVIVMTVMAKPLLRPLRRNHRQDDQNHHQDHQKHYQNPLGVYPLGV